MKVFITGTWRSGTTLLSQILNANTQLSVTYDAVNFMRFVFDRYGKAPLSQNTAMKCCLDVEERLLERFGHRIGLKAFEQNISKYPRINYAAIYDLIMQLYTGNSNWGEKTVLQWRAYGYLMDMFDDMFFVHIIRDPRDVMCSWKKYTIAPGYDYLDAVGNCYDSMKSGWGNQHHLKYILVKYEDLLTDPETTISSICKKIGIAFEPGMLDVNNYRNKVTGEVLVNSSYQSSFSKISTSPIGRWKEHLSREDLLIIELFIGELMDTYGYKRSANEWTKADIDKAINKISRSVLAWNGVENILRYGKGVQRNPLDEFDKSTWEIESEKL